MKAFLSRSAVIVSALLISLIVFSAQTSVAETPLSGNQPQQKGQQSNEADGTLGKAVAKDALPVNRTSKVEAEAPLGPATSYEATAYNLPGRTASGRMVSRGLIAADPRVLPLGSRVRLEVAGYHGEYLVADTGRLIKGKRIDIWIPTSREAMKFGRRKVKLTVLSYPTRRAGTKKRAQI